jgi:hypothetical protein
MQPFDVLPVASSLFADWLCFVDLGLTDLVHVVE